MKFSALVCLSAFLAPALAPRQEPPPAPKKAENSIARFFQDEAERLTKEIEGAWMLLDYVDPSQAPDEGAAGGFATFHDGFLALMLTIDTYESRLFRTREFVLVNAGAYRYRFDGQAFLQLASMMSVSNQTEDGDIVHDPSNMVYEYGTTLKDDRLELRDSDGVTLSFRRITTNDFPDSAIRKLESERGGQARWEEEEPR